MKNIAGMLVLAALLFAAASSANAEPVTFIKLTGITGGQTAGTGVWRADLSGVISDFIDQIVIIDNSQGFGGFTGKFSGFDLDAIKLSPTSVDTAAEASALVGLNLFDFFPSGTSFTPGTQRAPVYPKLFGSVLAPPRVDPTVATLGLFDGEARIDSFADGFVSMGDAGVLTFDLTSSIDTGVAGFSMFLYIGEVGDNGEQANGEVFENNGPASFPNLEVQVNGLVSVPEPSGIALLAAGLVGLASVAYRHRKPA